MRCVNGTLGLRGILCFALFFTDSEKRAHRPLYNAMQRATAKAKGCEILKASRAAAI